MSHGGVSALHKHLLIWISPQQCWHLDCGYLGRHDRAICVFLFGVCPTIFISSVSSVPTTLDLTMLASIVSTFVVVYHVSAWIFMLVNMMSALARFATLLAGVAIAICIVHADCLCKTSEQGTQMQQRACKHAYCSTLRGKVYQHRNHIRPPQHNCSQPHRTQQHHISPTQQFSHQKQPCRPN